MDFDLKGVLDSIRTSTEGFSGQMAALQKQVDAIDSRDQERITGRIETKSLLDHLKENEGIQRLMRDGKGTAMIKLEGDASRLLDRKSVITVSASGSIGTDTGNPVGVATRGVMPIDRSPGITTEARYALRLRNVLYARPTKAALIDS